MIRKVITFDPVQSSGNSRGLRRPTLNGAIEGIASEDGSVFWGDGNQVGQMHIWSGGIPSLALKKKTHGASALLLIVGSMSTLRLVRLSAARSAVAGAKVQDTCNRLRRLPERGMKRYGVFFKGGQLGS